MLELLRTVLLLALSLLAYGLARRQTSRASALLWIALALMTFLSSGLWQEWVAPPVAHTTKAPVTQEDDLLWQRVYGKRPQVAAWRAEIEQAAAICQLSPFLIAAVMAQESNGEPNVTGAAGEIGLMQIMPFAERPLTWIRAHPTNNISWGACLLSSHLRRTGSLWHALKSYNGSGAQAARYADKVLAIYSSFIGLVSHSPMRGATLTKAWGVPVSYQRLGYHTGIDLSPGPDKYIYAVGEGKIIHVGPLYCNIAGKCRGPYAIIQQLAPTIYATYSHNAQSYVTIGQEVRAGQPIAKVGNLGYSYGSHLHFELCAGCIWTGDWTKPFSYEHFIDPQPFLPPN